MIFSTTDWLEIEEGGISEELLIETFAKDIHKTVYVSERGAIRGIISHGDFCRYITDNKPLIQRKFTSCTVQNEEIAKEILQVKANIYGIPVLDEEGHIIREWYKEVKDEECFPNCVLFSLYEQFFSDREGYFNILVMDLQRTEDEETAKKINEETEGKLLVIDKKDILNIDKYFEDIKPGVVYDNRQKYAGFLSMIYKRLGVECVFLNKRNAAEKIIDHILEFYGSAGILGSEAAGLPDEYKKAQSVCIFDDDEFAWNTDRGCFEYKGHLENDQVPEILWVSCCILKNPCIIYNEKVIPVVSSEYPIREKYVYTRVKGADNKAVDYDIVYNIIPKLNENNIKFIILFSSDNDCGQIKGFDIQEVERRCSSLQSYVNSLPNSFFNLDGSVSAGEICGESGSSAQGWYKKGYKEYRDRKGKYTNISRGERLVLGNPPDAVHKLWLFGPCLILGGLVDDASNIGSVLRKKIDNNYYIKNMGAMYETRNLCMRDAELEEGDIVVIQAYDNSIYENAGIKVCSLLDIYNKCPNVMEHIVDMPSHADAYLTEKIAERVYEVLLSEHMLESCDDREKVVKAVVGKKQIRLRKEKDNMDVPQGLKKWLSDLQAYKGENFSKTGAIVMNCNPFTLGHRYLIEQACTQVDKLLIFVLEEDKSFFKFEDRIEMVRLGTKDLDKVSVIPSGRYIISSETLPGYFEKEENPEIVLDATDDLDFFAKVIAKELNISVRFAGEEPIDGYTKQYNQAMRKVLPQNYIEFVEIPRKEQGESVISASRVRKLLKEKNYKDIEKLVMPQIYEYLAEHYFCNKQ